jgi:hypothetical protein
MKIIKMALMGGAAFAATSALAHAADLDALKAQIEALNARVAAMEATPAVPAGYSLLAISEGPLTQTPGLPMKNRELASYGDEATYITVLPTADAPAGATITWSGYVRAGVIYNNYAPTLKGRTYDADTETWSGWTTDKAASADTDDTDILARGQLRVTAATDTAVGEVGVDIRMRADFNGNGKGDVYSDVAWGYWAMTPEVTFGGGYAGSLGNIGYGYDGACTCYLTDSADVNFNPGDVTQLRLSYGSGPVSAAVAFEDASLRGTDLSASDSSDGDKLGVSGELKYSGDIFNGEVAAVWRDKDDNDDAGYTDLWQVGAGMAFALGDMANLSLAGAFGEGPFQTVASNSSQDAGEITQSLPYNQSWWGVSGLLSANLSEVIHAEVAAGYKNRDGDSFKTDVFDDPYKSKGADYETWAFLGGVYYDPVPQLTIGVEAEYFTVTNEATLENTSKANEGDKVQLDFEKDTFTLDLVSVWRF